MGASAIPAILGESMKKLGFVVILLTSIEICGLQWYNKGGWRMVIVPMEQPDSLRSN